MGMVIIATHQITLQAPIENLYQWSIHATNITADLRSQVSSDESFSYKFKNQKAQKVVCMSTNANSYWEQLPFSQKDFNHKSHNTHIHTHFPSL